MNIGAYTDTYTGIGATLIYKLLLAIFMTNLMYNIIR